jgi:adenylate kinase
MQEGVSKNICLFGPQGSGKGTQAERVSEWIGVPHISPGNIFRKAIAEHTPLGAQVEQVINAGQLVPNDVTNALMRERLEQEDCVGGYILDGYPRNQNQAEALDSMSSLTHVIVIDVSDEETVRRLSNRRVCTSCGMTYHLEFKKSIQPDICDSCGSALIQRDDDKPEAIRQRLEIYHRETEPLFSRYEQRGIVHRVNGAASIEEVWKSVQACF